MTASESVEIRLLTDHMKGNNKRLSWFIGIAATVLITLVGWILVNSNKESQFRGAILTEIRGINTSVSEIKTAVRNNNLSIQDINTELIKEHGYTPIARTGN